MSAESSTVVREERGGMIDGAVVFDALAQLRAAVSTVDPASLTAADRLALIDLLERAHDAA